MVIECSSCQARFKLADDKIKESGTKVRCTKCREVFTVFPESAPQISTPVVPVTPVIEDTPVPPPVLPGEQNVVSDDFFSSPEDSSFTTETTSPAGDFPANAEDDWNLKADSINFADNLAYDAGTSDLDAINFDDIEAPVFSVTPQKNEKFEFTDDIDFSLSDSSLKDETNDSYKINETSHEKVFPAEIDNDFEADFSFESPSLATTDNLNQNEIAAPSDDLSFSDTESFDDFSWGEEAAAPAAPAIIESAQEKQAPRQDDAAFDFSSFSFDEAPASLDSDKTEINFNVKTDTSSIDLSTGSEAESENEFETAAKLELDRPDSSEETQKSTQLQDRASVPPSVRPVRPRTRSRQKKKGSSSLVVKLIFVIALLLAVSYGVMNRDQIQKEFKNLLGNFIEKQVPIEASGQIGLVKLNGSYILNSQEGNLFVIRGDAVNEFKSLRSSVLVKGTIYGENGAVIQSQTAYCGNPLSDKSLKKLGFKDIREAMNNELGENLTNLNIADGKSVPCTIVFHKIPENIKEFSVEVLESKSGSK